MSHNHTSRHAGSYKYRIALAFVKPRGGQGQNGRLKCPLGFLVDVKDANVVFLLFYFVILSLGDLQKASEKFRDLG